MKFVFQRPQSTGTKSAHTINNPSLLLGFHPPPPPRSSLSTLSLVLGFFFFGFFLESRVWFHTIYQPITQFQRRSWVLSSFSPFTISGFSNLLSPFMFLGFNWGQSFEFSSLYPFFRRTQLWFFFSLSGFNLKGFDPYTYRFLVFIS